jgi:uncharacterized protein (UPF0261 family)
VQGVEVRDLDLHINDRAFAEAAVDALLAMMKSRGGRQRP